MGFNQSLTLYEKRPTHDLQLSPLLYSLYSKENLNKNYDHQSWVLPMKYWLDQVIITVVSLILTCNLVPD